MPDVGLIPSGRMDFPHWEGRAFLDKVRSADATEDFDRLVAAWEAFLSFWRTALNRCERLGEAKLGRDWVKNRVWSDPGLRYLWEARNAQEHDVDPNVFECDARLHLLPVTKESGLVLAVPDICRGIKLRNPSPVTLGELGMEFLDEVRADALDLETRVRAKLLGDLEGLLQITFRAERGSLSDPRFWLLIDNPHTDYRVQVVRPVCRPQLSTQPHFPFTDGSATSALIIPLPGLTLTPDAPIIVQVRLLRGKMLMLRGLLHGWEEILTTIAPDPWIPPDERRQ